MSFIIFKKSRLHMHACNLRMPSNVKLKSMQRGYLKKLQLTIHRRDMMPNAYIYNIYILQIGHLDNW